MKENKAMAQEILQISILYPKTSKESYHHIKFLEKYNKQDVLYTMSCTSTFHNIQRNTLVLESLFNKVY